MSQCYELFFYQINNKTFHVIIGEFVACNVIFI